jgi:hypothetical protein
MTMCGHEHSMRRRCDIHAQIMTRRA